MIKYELIARNLGVINEKNPRFLHYASFDNPESVYEGEGRIGGGYYVRVEKEPKKLEKFLNNAKIDLYSKLKYISKDINLFRIFFYDMNINAFYRNVNLLDKELDNLHTALIAAIYIDYKKLAKQIIKVATNKINDPDEYRYTALYAAVDKNDLELVKLLVKKGVPSQEREFNATYLAYTLRNKNGDSILKYLIKNKIGLDFRGVHGETVLERAIKDKNEEVINLLKEVNK
ncbi:MAG: ankyrin repeat domain-containing protein [Candidatus Omnitrophica bacterium]|nr:ankyrin repeat domain-containing protein [Candidatus Omnitrophota bacterium]